MFNATTTTVLGYALAHLGTRPIRRPSFYAILGLHVLDITGALNPRLEKTVNLFTLYQSPLVILLI